jgi:hypothetical protein
MLQKVQLKERSLIEGLSDEGIIEAFSGLSW